MHPRALLTSLKNTISTLMPRRLSNDDKSLSLLSLKDDNDLSVSNTLSASSENQVYFIPNNRKPSTVCSDNASSAFADFPVFGRLSVDSPLARKIKFVSSPRHADSPMILRRQVNSPLIYRQSRVCPPHIPNT